MKVVEFARDVKREALKVSWPSRKETTLTTVMVMVMVIIAAFFFLLTDQLIGFTINKILGTGV